MSKLCSQQRVSVSIRWRVLWLASIVPSAQACTEPSFVDADAEARRVDGAQQDETSAAAPSDASTVTGDAMSETAPGASELDGSGSVADDAGVHDDGASFALEAGADAASAPDADLSGALPAWALPLIGTYAKRSVTFSYDDAVLPPVNTRNIEHAIVKLTQAGGELELISQLCSYTVAIKGAQGSPPLSFKNPAGIPPLKGRIVLGASNTFSSEPMLQHLGFDPARGKTCEANGRRAKLDDQVWISGASCSCYATSVPELIDDCRIIDGDGDSKAGITARGPSPLGTTVTDYAIVFDYSVRIVDGRVNANQAPELREVRAQAPACINTAGDGCSVGNNALCPGGSTQLIRLDDQATCANLNIGDFGPPDAFPAEVNCLANSK